MKEVKRMLKSVEALEIALGFIVLMAVIASVAFLSGCTTGPDGIYIDETIWVYATNRIDRAIDKHSTSAATDEGRVGDDRTHKEASDENVGTPSVDASKPVVADSFVADWRYGGFNGSKAVEDKSCQIKSVSTSGKGVTFKLSGSWWGATHESPTMRCCAFYKDGSGRWVGGFWEWGSPDRTYRAFTNINDGYKGWDAKAFFAAKKHGFVICSKDGKKRSNFIED